MCLVREVNTLGAVVSPNGKLSNDKVYLAKQNIKINDDA